MITDTRIAHPLQIERGRYTNPKTPVENRICPCCNTNNVEDELHFLTKCPAYSNQRSSLYNDIAKGNIHFTSLSDEMKMIYMLNSEDATGLIVSKFIYECLQARSIHS